MATAKQLAALKKARAARKRNLTKKKSPAKRKKRVSIKKRKTAVKKRASIKRRKKRIAPLEYFVYFQKGKKGSKYFAHKVGKSFVFKTDSPPGMAKADSEKAAAFGKRVIHRLPHGYNLYSDVKKKRR